MCQIVQELRALRSPVPLHPRQWPKEPWSWLHLDFAGPRMGHLIQDVHSKWLDAHVMSSITSSKTIDVLRVVFATPQGRYWHGPSFVSLEFMQKNGIHHITSAPYHPSTNSLAERGVQMLKWGLKCTAGSTVLEKLSRFLFNYRITPHLKMGIALSELWRLDLIHPDVTKKGKSKQEKQKLTHDTTEVYSE